MPKFSVRKSITIDAPVAKVYEIVRDFHQWQSWSPWLIAEPTAVVTVEPDGKSYAWEGNVTGAGSMTVVSETAPKRIDYDLVFLKPFKSQADVSFAFEDKGGMTEATWTMDSSMPWYLFFLTKMMAAMIGMDYERGLKMLKDYVETGSVPCQLEFNGISSFKSIQYLGIQSECAMAEIGPDMSKNFGKLKDYLCQAGITPAGQPFALYGKWAVTAGTCVYTAGIPITSPPKDLPSDFISGEVAPERTYTVKLTGPYRHLGNAWAAGMMHARGKLFHQSKACAPFEVYENDPETTPENELVTTVHYPAK